MVCPQLACAINDTDVGHYQLIISRFARASASDDVDTIVDTIVGNGGIDIIDGGPGDEYALSFDPGLDATLLEGGSLTRTISVDDRAATDWTGSTVDFGDSSSPVPLSLDELGRFTLNHTYRDNGTFTVTITVMDDIGQTLARSFTAHVDSVAPTGTIGNSGPVAVARR